PAIVAFAPSMPSMCSAVSVTSVPAGYFGDAAFSMPSGAGPPSIGCSIPPLSELLPLLPWPSCWLVDEGVAWSWSPPLLQPVSTSAPPSTPAATVVMRRLRIKSPIHSGPINIIHLWGIGQISIGGRGIAQLRSSRPGAAAVMLQPRVVEGSGHVGGVLGWIGVEGRSAAWAAEPEALPVVVAE